MARYIRDFPLIGTHEQMYNALLEFLKSEGYKQKRYHGEDVLKKGNGWVSGPTFFKVTFLPNAMRVESWMMYAILPGVYSGELGLDGVVGCAAKGPWKARILRIEQMFWNAPVYPGQTAPAAQTAQQIPAAQPVPQQPQINRFCTKCGAERVGAGVFCCRCGNRL